MSNKSNKKNRSKNIKRFKLYLKLTIVPTTINFIFSKKHSIQTITIIIFTLLSLIYIFFIYIKLKIIKKSFLPSLSENSFLNELIIDYYYCYLSYVLIDIFTNYSFIIIILYFMIFSYSTYNLIKKYF